MGLNRHRNTQAFWRIVAVSSLFPLRFWLVPLIPCYCPFHIVSMRPAVIFAPMVDPWNLHNWCVENQRWLWYTQKKKCSLGLMGMGRLPGDGCKHRVDWLADWTWPCTEVGILPLPSVGKHGTDCHGGAARWSRVAVASQQFAFTPLTASYSHGPMALHILPRSFSAAPLLAHFVA